MAALTTICSAEIRGDENGDENGNNGKDDNENEEDDAGGSGSEHEGGCNFEDGGDSDDFNVDD